MSSLSEGMMIVEWQANMMMIFDDKLSVDALKRNKRIVLTESVHIVDRKASRYGRWQYH